MFILWINDSSCVSIARTSLCEDYFCVKKADYGVYEMGSGGAGSRYSSPEAWVQPLEPT